jgi:hypothetical protein
MFARAFAGWRRWPALLPGVLIFAVMLTLPGTTLPSASAEDPNAQNITRVEEDWELVLNDPANDITAPQFHTVMCARGSTSSVYAQVLWNYREQPDFRAGGLQLEAWDNDYQLDLLPVYEQSLSRDRETITWTQRLETNGSQLIFKLLDGRSISWGYFGGSTMTVDLKESLPHLNHYSSAASKANSCVTFGLNRVSLLRILRVRKYDASGLVTEDNTPITIYSAPESSPVGN